MLYEFVENLITGPHLRSLDDFVQVTVVGEFIRKTERADGNALLDTFEVRSRTAQIRFSRCSYQRRAVPHAVEHKVELDSVSVFDRHAAGHRFSAHGEIPTYCGTPKLAEYMWPTPVDGWMDS